MARIRDESKNRTQRNFDMKMNRKCIQIKPRSRQKQYDRERHHTEESIQQDIEEELWEDRKKWESFTDREIT